jgi:hypothetical protein
VYLLDFGNARGRQILANLQWHHRRASCKDCLRGFSAVALGLAGAVRLNLLIVDAQTRVGFSQFNAYDFGLNEGFAWIAHRLANGMYGYEAGNAAWVKLYINGQFKGVFVNAEQRNEQFLQNHGYYKDGATWLNKVDGSSSLEVGVAHTDALFSHSGKNSYAVDFNPRKRAVSTPGQSIPLAGS